MFIKYPSIVQFRDVVKYISKFFKNKVVITFKGTVKLHGTNAAIVILKDGTIFFQSRNNIITPEKDNAGFATYMDNFKDVIHKTFYTPKEDTIIYGEWCGGNIQKNIGIAGLNKMFIVFSQKYILECKYLKEHCLNIYNIHNFPTWEITIDFNNPEAAVDRLTEITNEVEKVCPVAKDFNLIGIGEGVVWTPLLYDLLHITDYDKCNSSLIFKVKGKKHSSSKVKVLVSLSPEQLKQIDKVQEVINYCVTKNRVTQAMQEINATSTQDTGKVIKWVMTDIIKEESDTITNMGVTSKEMGKSAPKAIKALFFAQLELT